MNRHFRVPPEHQVFWDDIKLALKAFIPPIIFVVVIVVMGLIAFCNL